MATYNPPADAAISNIGETSAQLTFSAPTGSDGPVSYYTLRVKKSSDTTFGSQSSFAAFGATITRMLTGLDPDTPYDVEIEAWYQSGLHMSATVSLTFRTLMPPHIAAEENITVDIATALPAHTLSAAAALAVEIAAAIPPHTLTARESISASESADLLDAGKVRAGETVAVEAAASLLAPAVSAGVAAAVEAAVDLSPPRLSARASIVVAATGGLRYNKRVVAVSGVAVGAAGSLRAPRLTALARATATISARLSAPITARSRVTVGISASLAVVRTRTDRIYFLGDQPPPDPVGGRDDENYLPGAGSITRSPQGPTQDLAHEWVSVRQRAPGAALWSEFSPWGLWSLHAEDGNGREYIYTSRADATPVTGAENLPLASTDYDVDALRAPGGLRRGAQRYYDDSPPDLSEDRPYQIAFWRVVPGQPDPNEDVGDVPWTQGPPLRVVGRAGEDGEEGAGVEYIFTSRADATPVTRAADLPLSSMDYDVDALRAPNGLRRGAQRYYDGSPPDLSEDRPYQIRFRRPVPGQPAQNEDIGNVDWVQEHPVRVVGRAGEDGEEGAGVEYIFTSRADATPVTRAADLPLSSMDYDVDALRAPNGLRRGAQRYYDGSPPDLSEDRPYQIRFRRPVPGQPAQNEDIGNVDWVQEHPVRVVGRAGEDGEDGEDAKDGEPGFRGKRTANGYVYWTGADTSSAPARPSSRGVRFDFGSGSPAGLPHNWGVIPPTAGAGSRQAIWYSYYRVAESGDYDAESDSYAEAPVVFGPVTLGIQFAGLVTFAPSDDGGVDLVSGGRPLTEINGGFIRTGTINLSAVESDTFFGTAGTDPGNRFALGTPVTLHARDASYRVVGYFEGRGGDFALGALNSGTSSSSRSLGYAFGAISTSGKVACFYARSGAASSHYNVCIGEGANAIQAPNFTLSSAGYLAARGVRITSDRRLKSGLRRIDGALSKLDRIAGYTYTMDGARKAGLVAQEVADILPEAVDDSGEHHTVDMGAVLGWLVEVAKELREAMHGPADER